MRYLLQLAVVSMIGLNVAQAFDVKETLFSDFARVQDYCNASVTYDLEASFAETAPRYHETMGCLFSTATAGWLEKERAFFADKLSDLDSDYELISVGQSPKSCAQNFSAIVLTQENAGFNSFCEASGSNAKKEYSFCRVAEAAYNEFCAYQEYAYFKTRPEILLEQCTTDSLLENRNDCAEEQARIEADQMLARNTLELSLTRYERLTESWSLHGWLVVMAESLENTYRRLDLARIALEKWPLKFHDASSQKASSLNAE